MPKCWEIIVVLGEEVLSGSHSRGRPCLARGLARLSQGADLKGVSEPPGLRGSTRLALATSCPSLAWILSIPILGTVDLVVRHGTRRAQMLGNRNSAGES